MERSEPPDERLREEESLTVGASTITKQARRSAGISAARRVGKARRHFRLRKKVTGTTERPRLVVSRSSRHLFAQVVDDSRGVTLASASRSSRRRAGC